LGASPGKEHKRIYLEKTHHKQGLVEWLKWSEHLFRKCGALSPNSSGRKKEGLESLIAAFFFQSLD
jgi:hypothetical protein